MSDIAERLREITVDWNGEQIVDGSSPRVETTCGMLRQAAVEIERLRSLLESVTSVDMPGLIQKNGDLERELLMKIGEVERLERQCVIIRANARVAAIEEAIRKVDFVFDGAHHDRYFVIAALRALVKP